jgi:pimeloyl-ACP methyl ester carboxylesterase
MEANVDRRSLLAGAAALGALVTAPARAQDRPRNFVLVHGAWHGGWCWVRVRDILQSAGHRVFTPTLTGLGERSHLLSPNLTVDTYVSDVANVFTWEDLKDACLVGHSFGGFVISAVCEKVPDRISSIVYLDAFLGENGKSANDSATQRTRDNVQALLDKGEIAMPVPKAAAFRVNEKDQAWVDSKLTPHPIAPDRQKITLTGARDKIARKTYIRATANGTHPILDALYAQSQQDKAWRAYGVPCGHDVMIDMPERLAEILQEVA